jgi:hypothetical protein
VDAVVEEGGAGGGGKNPLVPVGFSLPDLPMGQAVYAEVEAGSATSWGRPPERSYLVRLRRAERSVVVAAGMTRSAAERLADRASEVLGPAAAPARPLGPAAVHGVGEHPCMS